MDDAEIARVKTEEACDEQNDGSEDCTSLGSEDRKDESETSNHTIDHGDNSEGGFHLR